MKPYITLIIPAYNEEACLENSLVKATDYLVKNNINYEIITVDDGSTDKTANIAKNFGQNVKLISQPQNMGKGAAVRRGMIEGEGEILVFSDADFSTPIYELDKILDGLRNGADVCIGSRAVDYSMIKEHQPFYREFMGKTFNKIVQLFVLKGIKDTQCGFKGFTENAAKHIFSKAQIDGFGFDVEILYLARHLGLRIDEIPVEWYNEERSAVNPIKDSFKMLIEIFKIKKLHR